MKGHLDSLARGTWVVDTATGALGRVIDIVQDSGFTTFPPLTPSGYVSFLFAGNIQIAAHPPKGVIGICTDTENPEWLGVVIPTVGDTNYPITLETPIYADESVALGDLVEVFVDDRGEIILLRRHQPRDPWL